MSEASKDYGLVSIVMPSYNSATYIAETITSVRAQTYGDWELLVVDDCSQDDTVKVVKAMAAEDDRIQVFVNERNLGAACSRNKALREAKGDWVAFLDSDDLWAPEKLKEQLAFMVANDYDFTFTDYRIVGVDGKMSPYVFTSPDVVRRRDLLRYCFFSTITVMYRRDAVGLIQIADLKKNNDYAMWLQASTRVDCFRYPKPLSVYCRREGSISSGSKLKLIKHHYIMFRKALGYGVAASALATLRNLVWGVYKKLRYRIPATDYFKESGELNDYLPTAAER